MLYVRVFCPLAAACCLCATAAARCALALVGPTGAVFHEGVIAVSVSVTCSDTVPLDDAVLYILNAADTNVHVCNDGSVFLRAQRHQGWDLLIEAQPGAYVLPCQRLCRSVELTM